MLTTATRWSIALLGAAGLACETSQAEPAADRRARLEAMVKEVGTRFPEVRSIDVEGLRRLRSEGEVILVDVREPEERAVSTLPGALSVEEFEARLEEPEATVVTYCTIGHRSAIYTRKLQERGWNAFNLEGSILAWTHAGGPLVDSQGAPTRRVHVYGPRWNLAADGYEPVW